MMCTSETRRG